jgi:hypothetical protein
MRDRTVEVIDLFDIIWQSREGLLGSLQTGQPPAILSEAIALCSLLRCIFSKPCTTYRYSVQQVRSYGFIMSTTHLSSLTLLIQGG